LRARALLALLLSVVVALGGALVAAPSSAHAAVVSVSDAVFRWGLNAEANRAAYAPGTVNLLSAGEVPKTSASDLVTADDWRQTDGNVSIEKRLADGGFAPATYAGLFTDANGTTLTTGGTANSGHEVVISGGVGTVDPETGEADLAWTGSFTVAFYSGMTQFSVTDPHLHVGADGEGVVTADLSGYGTSMEDPTLFVVLDPAQDVEIATLHGVEVGADGILVTPAYAGVTITPPAGLAEQQDGGYLGSFPQPFIDYLAATGAALYWYSSGGLADRNKAATPITVQYAPAEPEVVAASITTDPASVSVAAGEDATFTVAADGTAPLSYQWQRRAADAAADAWTAIDGAQEASYTFEAAAEDDGASFRVVVDNAAAAPATSAAATLTVLPAGTEPISTSATFEWAINESSQGAAANGACNMFVAGIADGTEATYRSVDGDVHIIKRAASGAAVEVTPENRCVPVTANDARQRALFTNGVVTEADGVTTVRWTGAFTVYSYGGLVPWYVKDPTLTIEGDTGRITAEVGGFASSMSDPNVKEPLAPETGVTILDLEDVSIDGDDVSATPVWTGVDYHQLVDYSDPSKGRKTESAIPDSVKASNPNWGSWPESFVDFQYRTGLSSYWHSSGLSADPSKPPLPIELHLAGGLPPLGTLETLQFTAQPTAFDAIPGEDVTFTAAAQSSGDAPVAYQWQISRDNNLTWTDIPGADAAELTLEDVATTDTNSFVRVVATNGSVSAVSSTARLRVQAAAAITISTSPAPVITRFVGAKLILPVYATGYPAPSYAWEISRDGGATWTEYRAASAAASLLIESAGADFDGAMFRAVVSNRLEPRVVSSAGTVRLLTADGPTLLLDPDRYAADYVFDPANRNNVFVVAGGLPITSGNLGAAVVTRSVWDARATTPITADNAVFFQNIQVASNIVAGTGGSWALAVPADAFQPGTEYLAVVFDASTDSRASDAAVEIPLPAAEGGEEEPIVVTDAQLQWTYNGYAQTGVFGPWWQDTSGADVSLWKVDGQVATGSAADAGKTFTGVRFTGGEGTLDPVTGAGTITWSDTGNWVLNAYKSAGILLAPDETLSNPILTIAEDGTGTLSFDAYLPAHVDYMAGTNAPVPAVGPDRKVLATFSSVTLEDGVLRFTPDFAGRSYEPEVGSPWTDCDGVGGSWPAEWIDFLPSSVQAHYYTTSCTGLNLTKAPHPVSVVLAASEGVTITQQPSFASTDLKTGREINLQVVADGAPLRYQWQRSVDDGATWTDIAGRTGSNYRVAVAPEDDGARFRVVVTNGAATVTSEATEAITVTSEAAAISDDLWGPDRVGLGEAATYGVVVTGAPYPTVQWRVSRDGGDTWQSAGEGAETISGDVKQSLLSLPAVTAEDDGAQFRAEVFNGVGSTEESPLLSRVITLDVVNELPAFVQQPKDGAAIAGGSVTFSSEASALPAPAYQWEISTDEGESWTDYSFTGGIVQQSGTDKQLIIRDVPASYDGALLRVRASNAAGTVSSETVRLTVVAKNPEGPTLAVLPAGPVSATGTTTLTVLGAGFEAPADADAAAQVLRVGILDAAKWQPGQPGVTSISEFVDSARITALTLTNGGGYFSVSLLVSEGSVDASRGYAVVAFSNVADQRFYDAWQPLVIEGQEAPAVTGQPASATVISGSAAELSVTATGGPAIGYQWQRATDGGFVDVEGATTATLSTTEAGEYRVVVSTVLGSATSEVATVTVLPVPTVTVSRTSGLDPDGETVRVTGTGFLPNGTLTDGTRPPLAGQFAGAYVVFGRFAEDWRPSEGGSGRTVITQLWAVPAAVAAERGGLAAGYVGIDADGSFSADVLVKTGAVDAEGAYGIYTYAGGGAVYAPFETATPLVLDETAPAFSSGPQDVAAPVIPASGDAVATFSVAATGAPAPEVSWQLLLPGGEWQDVAGATGSTLALPYGAEHDGARVRAVATNPFGSATSAEATLTVGVPVGITTQPESQLVTAGEAAHLEVGVVGDEPSIRWQVRAPGASAWADVPGATGAELEIAAADVRDGQAYRAVVSGPIPTLPGGSVTSATSEAATLRLGVPGTPADDIPDELLTAEAAGGVTVEKTGDRQFVVDLGDDRGAQVYGVWVHSTPAWAGWAVASADGRIAVTVPADVPAGAHRLVVVDAAGNLVGWVAVVVGADGSAAVVGSLSGTGVDPLPLGAVAALLLVLGVAALLRRRGRATV